MLRAGVGKSDLYERDARVEPVSEGGDVGEG